MKTLVNKQSLRSVPETLYFSTLWQSFLFEPINDVSLMRFVFTSDVDLVSSTFPSLNFHL